MLIFLSLTSKTPSRNLSIVIKLKHYVSEETSPFLRWYLSFCVTSLWTGCVFKCLKPSSNCKYHQSDNIHNCVPGRQQMHFYIWFRWMSLFQGSSAPGLGHMQWCYAGATKIIYTEHWMHCQEYKFTQFNVLQECNKHVTADMTVYLTPSMKWVKENWYLYFNETRMETIRKMPSVRWHKLAKMAGSLIS
jgi:hypothetical protein